MLCIYSEFISVHSFPVLPVATKSTKSIFALEPTRLSSLWLNKVTRPALPITHLLTLANVPTVQLGSGG